MGKEEIIMQSHLVLLQQALANNCTCAKSSWSQLIIFICKLMQIKTRMKWNGLKNFSQNMSHIWMSITTMGLLAKDQSLPIVFILVKKTSWCSKKKKLLYLIAQIQTCSLDLDFTNCKMQKNMEFERVLEAISAQEPLQVFSRSWLSLIKCTS